MSTATKAAAMRWFDKHAGRHIHTKWKRPSGWTTVDESRLLTKDGSAFRLDSSRFSDPRDKNTIVREVADERSRHPGAARW